jgi:hypothetical protein
MLKARMIPLFRDSYGCMLRQVGFSLEIRSHQLGTDTCRRLWEPPISRPRSAASRLSSSPVRRHCKEATQAIRFVLTIVASAGRIRSAVRRGVDAYQAIRAVLEGESVVQPH